MRAVRFAGPLAASLVLVPLLVATGPSASASGPAPCPTQSAHPWCNRSLSPDKRAALFQQAMTVDEEITLVGGDGADNNGFSGSGHTGATYAIPRLGLPAVYFTDGPVGVRQGRATAMPIPMALAATFDAASAYRAGRTVATEAKDKGKKKKEVPAKRRSPVLALVGGGALGALLIALAAGAAWYLDYPPSSPSAPPNTVASWLNTATGLPSTVPVPVTTPSPNGRRCSIPKFVERWRVSASNSTNFASCR